MTIWVDADACPNTVKEILFRAAIRKKIIMILVANQALNIPRSPYIKQIQVSSGFDVADNMIIEKAQNGDLVITADIPLADAVISNGAIALNPRGKLYSKENIKQNLSVRNFNESLRSNGVLTGGPPPLGKKEIQAFANFLDQYLAKN
jgi:uncharacterized protein YaiI (UPF0178 family)